MPVPRSFLGAWREMRQTWRRQQTDPGYAFDTPVPSADPDAAEQAPEAASIGDIAPKALR